METTEVLETLLKVWSLLEKLATAFRPPLRGDVVCLAYYDFDRIRGDGGFITTYPQRYLAEAELTNRSGQATYIKRVVLTLNGTKRYEQRMGEPVKLDSHEIRREGFVFPVGKGDTPLEKADFVLEIIPSVGRRTKLQGRMPVNKDD